MIPVAIPPLRDRSDDILPLAQRFMREFSRGISIAISGALRRKPSRLCSTIPGPAMFGSCATASSGRWRSRRHRGSASTRSFPSGAAEPDGAPLATLAEVRDRAERQHIRAVLTDVDNRIDEAAKRLGVARSTLFEKMRKLDIRSEA